MSEALATTEEVAPHLALAGAPEADAQVWQLVCALDELEPQYGEPALVQGHMVALFRLHDRVYATDLADPHTGAPVIAHGIVGSRGDAVTVASPLHKEVYDLATGECLNGDSQPLPIHPVRTRQGQVFVRIAA